MSSLIILLLAMAYWQYQQTQNAVVTICLHCGAAVLHAPGLLYACPCCRRWWIG